MRKPEKVEVKDDKSASDKARPWLIGLGVLSFGLALVLGIVLGMRDRDADSKRSGDADDIAIESTESAFTFPKELEGCVNCDSYSKMLASEKLETLWRNIEETKYDELPEDWIRVDEVDRLTDGLDVNFIFDRFSDERPADVARFFHEYGSVAQVEWVPPSQPTDFTGLFQGSDYGLLRISHCAPLITLGMRPPYSFALKMLRSELYSANLITCEPPLRDDESAPDDDYNVFRRTLTTST